MREVTQKLNLPKPNMFERALSHVAAPLAVKQYRSRCALSALGAYPGTSKKRGRGMVGGAAGDFDTEVLPELQDLRDESEHLYRHNMLAAAGINTENISVIGRGLTAQPRIDAAFLGLSDDQADLWEMNVGRRWLHFSESKHCTVNKRYNFREYQSIAFLSSLLRGDSFTLTPEQAPTDYFPYKLRLQLIEADRVCNPDHGPDTDRLSGGIALDDNGAVHTLHFLKGHPGSILSTNREWDSRTFFGEKTGRRNILQLMEAGRADQGRGVPKLATVMEGLSQFGKLTQATIDAAVIQTFLAVFIETPDGNGFDLPESDAPGTGRKDKVVELKKASIIDLAEGEVPHVVNPTHPNSNYNAFAEVFSSHIGAALNIPKEVLTKYFQSSYTAAQGALLEAWRYFMMRRSRIIDNLCQPTYELFLAGEVAAGRVWAPGFFTDPIIRAAWCGADWAGPPRGHIREDVQNKADGYAEDRGWKTSDQNTQERGNRWERNHRQRVKEVRMRREGGLITTEEDRGREDLTGVTIKK
jgi:lambda family phage portal protein